MGRPCMFTKRFVEIHPIVVMVFVMGLAVLPAPSQGQMPTESVGRTADAEAWNSIQDSDDPLVMLAYVMQYPEGRFADLARERLGRTAPPSSVVAASPPLLTRSMQAISAEDAFWQGVRSAAKGD